METVRKEQQLIVSVSPHVKSEETTARIMWTVNAALLPATVMGAYFFGPRAMLNVALSIVVAILCEYLYQKALKQKKRGYDVKLGKFPFGNLAKPRIVGHDGGFVKVVADGRYDEVLGVHMIGPHATDLIAEACVALRLETTVEEITRTIHAHPTLAEAMMQAAEAVYGHAIDA